MLKQSWSFIKRPLVIFLKKIHSIKRKTHEAWEKMDQGYTRQSQRNQNQAQKLKVKTIM